MLSSGYSRNDVIGTVIIDMAPLDVDMTVLRLLLVIFVVRLDV